MQLLAKRISFLVLSLLFFTNGFSQHLSRKEKGTLKRITKSINYLASDQLEGRQVGTNGEKLSATFIAENFAKLGLKPLGNEQYYQDFRITTLRIADSKSKVVMNNDPFKLFVDYYPLSYSSNTSDVSSALVDAGFGIVNEKRNDYANIDAKDKIVLINISSPDGVHPHSAFVAWHGINIRVDEAVKHGAVGVVFYRSDEKVEAPESSLSLKMKSSTVPVIFMSLPMKIMGQWAFAQIQLNILTDGDMGRNVIGFKDNDAENTVVIGAHHDHLGIGGHPGSLSGDVMEIHNGADDNASGVAAMLELARKLKKTKSWNKGNNYLFIAFSGEESGLLGSKYFTENPTIDLSSVNYMINMDMVGMLDSTTMKLIVNGIGTGNEWKPSLERLNKDLRGIKSIETTEGGIGPSDQTSFYLKQIPAIHFFTGAHAHYHKPTDDVKNLNLGGEVYVINYIFSMIKDLNSLPKQQFIETKSADSMSRSSNGSKFKVTLGIVPSYTFDGEGLLVDAVREGKPASKAGLQSGDVIISLSNRKVSNMSDYMEILQTINPGDTSEVQLMRDNQVLSLEIQF